MSLAVAPKKDYPVIQVMKVLGWDFGHGFGKFHYVEKQEHSPISGKLFNKMNCFAIPSVTYNPKKAINISSVLTAEGYCLSNLSVEYNGKIFYVGEKAAIKDAEGGDMNFQKTRFKDDAAVVQLLAALAFMYPEASKIEVEYLMIGLSLESYGQYRKECEEFYTARVFNFKVPESDGTMREIVVQIDNVRCSAQGIGAYYDYFIEFSRLKVLLSREKEQMMQYTRFGVVDVGSKTVDIFAAEGLEPVDDSDICIDGGISEIFEDLSLQYGGAPVKTIERDYFAGKSRFYYDGRHYENFQKTVHEKSQALAGEISNKIYKKWRHYLKQIEVIILCGGGATVLKEELVKLIPNIQIIIPCEPQFANARGFFKLGYIMRGEFEQEAAE